MTYGDIIRAEVKGVSLSNFESYQLLLQATNAKAFEVPTCNIGKPKSTPKLGTYCPLPFFNPFLLAFFVSHTPSEKIKAIQGFLAAFVDVSNKGYELKDAQIRAPFTNQEFVKLLEVMRVKFNELKLLISEGVIVLMVEHFFGQSRDFFWPRVFLRPFFPYALVVFLTHC